MFWSTFEVRYLVGAFLRFFGLAKDAPNQQFVGRYYVRLLNEYDFKYDAGLDEVIIETRHLYDYELTDEYGGLPIYVTKCIPIEHEVVALYLEGLEE